MYETPYTRHDHKSVDIKETHKTAEIFDALKNLRYKIYLECLDLICKDGIIRSQYIIRVVNFFYGPTPLVILTRPDEGEDPILDYKKAVRIYDDCVKNYSSLVKAETRDLKDIDIYAERIGYKETKPACCATCKWCRQNRNYHDDYRTGVTGKLECWNPKNKKEYEFEPDCECQHCPTYKPSHFIGELPPEHMDGIGHLHDEFVNIHPHVQPLGVCDNYEAAYRPAKPVPGESLVHMVDRKVQEKFSGNISSEIVPVVAKEIEHQLSAHMPYIEGNRGLSSDEYNADACDREMIVGCDLGA